MQIQLIQALSNLSIYNYKQSITDKKNKITFRAKEAQLEKFTAAASGDLLKRIDLWKNQTKQGLKELIQTMIDNGYTEKEMSSALDIVVSKVKSFIKEFGLKTNKKAKYMEKIRSHREERRAKIQMLADAGFTKKEIAKTLNISEQIISKYVRIFDIKLKTYIISGSVRISREDLCEKLQMFADEGFTKKEIAKKLNLPESTISYYMSNFGIKIKRDVMSGDIRIDREELHKKLQMLADEGLTQKEIANKLNLPESLISYYTRNFGIKVKKNIVRGNVQISEEEYRGKLQEMVDKGYTYTRMAEELKFPRDRISKDIKNFGIKFDTLLRSGVRIDIEEYRTKLQQLANEGMSVARMAEELHMSMSSIFQDMKKFGIKKEMGDKVKTTILRDGIRIDKEEYRTQLQELTEQGLDAREISLKLNISFYSIINDLKKFGIKRNSRKGIIRGGATVNREEYRAKLQALADRGFSSHEIAQELDLTYGTIRRDLKKFGIKTAQGKHMRAYMKFWWEKFHGQN